MVKKKSSKTTIGKHYYVSVISITVIILIAMFYFASIEENLSDEELDQELNKFSNEELKLVLTEEDPEVLTGKAWGRKSTPPARRLSGEGPTSIGIESRDSVARITPNRVRRMTSANRNWNRLRRSSSSTFSNYHYTRDPVEILSTYNDMPAIKKATNFRTLKFGEAILFSLDSNNKIKVPTALYRLLRDYNSADIVRALRTTKLAVLTRDNPANIAGINHQNWQRLPMKNGMSGLLAVPSRDGSSLLPPGRRISGRDRDSVFTGLLDPCDRGPSPSQGQDQSGFAASGGMTNEQRQKKINEAKYFLKTFRRDSWQPQPNFILYEKPGTKIWFEPDSGGGIIQSDRVTLMPGAPGGGQFDPSNVIFIPSNAPEEWKTVLATRIDNLEERTEEVGISVVEAKVNAIIEGHISAMAKPLLAKADDDKEKSDCRYGDFGECGLNQARIGRDPKVREALIKSFEDKQGSLIQPSEQDIGGGEYRGSRLRMIDILGQPSEDMGSMGFMQNLQGQEDVCGRSILFRFFNAANWQFCDPSPDGGEVACNPSMNMQMMPNVRLGQMNIAQIARSMPAMR